MAKQILTEILVDIGNIFELAKFEGDEHKYSAEIRTSLCSSDIQMRVDYSKLCDLWKEKFSELTKTNWITRKTWPNAKQYLYKKRYVCHHSSFKKTSNLSYKEKPRSRDKECQASIEMKFKKNTKSIIKRDAFMKKALNVIVKICFSHSHLVEVAEAYSFLRMTNSTRETFQKYFDQGLSASGARNFHEIFLMAQSEELGVDVGPILADAQINPTQKMVSQEYDTWRKQQYGGRTTESVVEMLKAKKDQYRSAGIEVVVEENPFTVVIITPTMRRVHNQAFAGEIVFVDSSGSCDQMGTCLTMLFCRSKVGALPLACMLHTSQTSDSYRAVFSRAKAVIGDGGFGGGGYPAVLMTDDCDAERSALSSTFPLSTLLLCSFHVCQALWRWLLESVHGIEKQDRRHLMQLFRGVIFENDITECEEKFESLRHDVVRRRYAHFIAHITKFWQRRREWAYCYRQTLPTRGSNTNNYVEASIRIFKDLVLQRCKSFNACALVDFVGNVFETYHKRKLLNFANSRVPRQELLYLKLVKKSCDLHVTQVNEFEFQVNSARDATLAYLVDIEFEVCDCPSGNGGSFCKHLCAVNIKLNGSLTNAPGLDSCDRVVFAQIALGDSARPQFYQNMMADKVENFQPPEMDIEPTSQNEAQIPEFLNTEPSNSAISVPAAKSEQFLKYVEQLRAGYENLCDLVASEDYSPALEKILKRAANEVKKINTPAQGRTYLASRSSMYGSKRILAQPTSVSRRKKRSGLKFGASVIQSGRPAFAESRKVSRPKRKKRDLGHNISLNQANAKSHGSGH